MTLGLFVVISIINGFIGMVFAIPQYIVTALYAIGSVEGETPGSGLHLAMVITTIIQTFGSHLLNAVLVLTVVLQYFNLVEIKEGVGTMARLDEIGAERDVEPPF
jgi:hypothetical protein